MKNTWKTFIAVMLMIVGLQLNFTGQIFIMQVEQWIQNTVLLSILILIAFGIWWEVYKKDSNHYLKDFSTMGLIIIGIYYFGPQIQLEKIIDQVPSLIVQIISIALICIAVAIIVAQIVIAYQKKSMKEPIRRNVSAHNSVPTHKA